jgi:hypothetical protein
MPQGVWGSINTCFEIGLEILRLMATTGAMKGVLESTEVEQITDGVLLMSNDKEILIAVKNDTAKESLSETAVSYGEEKGDYIIYNGAAAAIPLYELSRNNESVRDFIVSEESLRATLCGNYPEYVKTHNMNASPGDRIKDADAPPDLFLQKQLDHAADETRSQVSEYQAARDHEADRGRGMFDDVLELER